MKYSPQACEEVGASAAGRGLRSMGRSVNQQHVRGLSTLREVGVRAARKGSQQHGEVGV